MFHFNFRTKKKKTRFALYALSLIIITTSTQPTFAITNLCNQILSSTKNWLKSNSLKFNSENAIKEQKVRRIKVPINNTPPQPYQIVEESYTTVVSYDPNRANVVITKDLLFCIAVVIYDPSSKTGLVSHWVTANQNAPSINWYLNFLKKLFHQAGAQWDQAQVTLIQGHDFLPSDRTTFKRLVNAFAESDIQSVYEDTHRSIPQESRKLFPRAIHLDLNTGLVSEIGHIVSWGFSNLEVTESATYKNPN